MAGFIEVKQLAQGRWYGILVALGVPSESLTSRHKPCPACGGKDRFRFDDLKGHGTFYCSGGGSPTWGDGFELLKHIHGWSASEAKERVADYLGGKPKKSSMYSPSMPTAKQPKNDYALRLWSERVEGVQFHTYAKKKDILFEAGAARHKSVWGRVVGQSSDCILVPITDFRKGEIVAVQAINGNGEKQTFGSVKNCGFVIGDTSNTHLDWIVVEGWADAVSTHVMHWSMESVVFAACGSHNMKPLAETLLKVFSPDKNITILEDAA
jgi:putative DNA primase/helicase